MSGSAFSIGTSVSGSSVTQFVSQTSVTITHNWYTYPITEVVDDTGAVLIPLTITHNSANSSLCTATTITFDVAKSGRIVLSYGAIPGPQGPKGDTGAGMTSFAGGSTGQALTKLSNADYDYVWATLLSILSGDVTTSGQVATIANNIIDYARIANNLKSSLSSNTGAYDFSANGIIVAALSTTTGVTFSNLQQNKTLKMKLTISGGATITFPAYCIKMAGSQTLGDGTFYLYFDCWNATVGSELVIYSIMKSA